MGMWKYSTSPQNKKDPRRQPESLAVSAHLAFEPDTYGWLARLDNPLLPRQANITANDSSRDYHRISQPLFAWLWLKACDYGWKFSLNYGLIASSAENTTPTEEAHYFLLAIYQALQEP